MNKPTLNYAFIDGQNFHKSITAIGGSFNYLHFRRYLAEKHGVGVAYYFVGYIEANESLYRALRGDGYELAFKEVARSQDKYKGNVDVNLTVRALIEIDKYDKAVIITSDGDYAVLVEHLNDVGKLQCLIACSRGGCSYLLRKLHNRIRIYYMDDIMRDLRNRAAITATTDSKMKKETS